jgi:hypothetical protein
MPGQGAWADLRFCLATTGGEHVGYESHPGEPNQQPGSGRFGHEEVRAGYVCAGARG